MCIFKIENTNMWFVLYLNKNNAFVSFDFKCKGFWLLDSLFIYSLQTICQLTSMSIKQDPIKPSKCVDPVDVPGFADFCTELLQTSTLSGPLGPVEIIHTRRFRFGVSFISFVICYVCSFTIVLNYVF